MKQPWSSQYRCPRCTKQTVMVYDSRQGAGGERRRRRRCEACGFRWTTIEIDEVLAKRFMHGMASLDHVIGEMQELRRQMQLPTELSVTEDGADEDDLYG